MRPEHALRWRRKAARHLTAVWLVALEHATSLLFVGCAIGTQVHLGRVYEQPGCPRRCRCCCPGPKRRRGRANYGTKQVTPLSVSPPDSDQETPLQLEEVATLPSVHSDREGE